MTTAAAELAGPKLRAWFDYSRFADRHARVLLLEPHYYLARELRAALIARGHQVATVPVPRSLQPGEDWVQQLLLAAARHRPDFLLTINHFGFDENGSLAALFDSLGLPCAVWYVDSPETILAGDGHGHAQTTTSVFVWERTLMATMTAHGFAHVEHLPLAADARRIAAPVAAARWPLVFVGESWTTVCMKDGRHLQPTVRRAAEPAIDALAADGHRPTDELLRLAGAGATSARQRAHTLGYVQGAASGRWRQRVLAALPQDQLHVFGDAAWTQLLPAAHHHPPADYLTETAEVYRHAGVVVNATSRQMPTALNQRVFDVPAMGGCLLTDAQDDLGVLFASDEVTVYHEPAEAREQAAWLAAHPRERQRRRDRAAARIAHEHCYEHRVDRIVGSLRRRYRS